MPKVKICFIDSSIDHFSEEYKFLMRTESSGWEELSQKDYIRLLERKDLLSKVLRGQGLIKESSEIVILAQDIIKPSWALGQVNKLLSESVEKENRAKKRARWRRNKNKKKEIHNG